MQMQQITLNSMSYVCIEAGEAISFSCCSVSGRVSHSFGTGSYSSTLGCDVFITVSRVANAASHVWWEFKNAQRHKESIRQWMAAHTLSSLNATVSVELHIMSVWVGPWVGEWVTSADSLAVVWLHRK